MLIGTDGVWKHQSAKLDTHRYGIQLFRWYPICVFINSIKTPKLNLKTNIKMLCSIHTMYVELAEMNKPAFVDSHKIGVLWLIMTTLQIESSLVLIEFLGYSCYATLCSGNIITSLSMIWKLADHWLHSGFDILHLIHMDKSVSSVVTGDSGPLLTIGRKSDHKWAK